MLSLSVVAVLTQLDTSGVAYTPALMWGPEGLGFGRGAKHLDAVSGQDLEVAVAALLGQPGNEGAPLLASEPARGARLPEVQLVCVCFSTMVDARSASRVRWPLS